MRSGPGMSGLHRKGFPRPPERPDPRLLACRDDDGVVGREGTEADHVAQPDLEPRVAGDPEGLHLVRPEAVVLQDAVHGGDGHPRPRSRPAPSSARHAAAVATSPARSRPSPSPRGPACLPADGWRHGGARPRPPRGNGPVSAGPSASTCPSDAWSPSARSPSRARR